MASWVDVVIVLPSGMRCPIDMHIVVKLFISMFYLEDGA